MVGNEKTQQGNFLGLGFQVTSQNCADSAAQNEASSKSLSERNPAPNASAPAVSTYPTVHFVVSC